jgi:hypothetical protein
VGIRAFKAGQYVNTPDGFTALIYGRDHEENQIAICQHDEERSACDSELTPWSPRNGERVAEAGNEHSPLGIVVEAGEGTSLVVWKNFLRQQTWLHADLEPAWSD